jgi:lipid-A-disaccharide synthase
MDQEIVKELIQNELNENNLKVELTKLLNTDYQQQLKKSYEALRTKLGGKGASARAAKKMIDYLQNY